MCTDGFSVKNIFEMHKGKEIFRKVKNFVVEKKSETITVKLSKDE